MYNQNTISIAPARITCWKIRRENKRYLTSFHQVQQGSVPYSRTSKIAFHVLEIEYRWN